MLKEDSEFEQSFESSSYNKYSLRYKQASKLDDSIIDYDQSQMDIGSKQLSSIDHTKRNQSIIEQLNNSKQYSQSELPSQNRNINIVSHTKLNNNNINITVSNQSFLRDLQESYQQNSKINQPSLNITQQQVKENQNQKLENQLQNFSENNNNRQKVNLQNHQDNQELSEGSVNYSNFLLCINKQLSDISTEKNFPADYLSIQERRMAYFKDLESLKLNLIKNFTSPLTASQYSVYFHNQIQFQSSHNKILLLQFLDSNQCLCLNQDYIQALSSCYQKIFKNFPTSINTNYSLKEKQLKMLFSIKWQKIITLVLYLDKQQLERLTSQKLLNSQQMKQNIFSYLNQKQYSVTKNLKKFVLKSFQLTEMIVQDLFTFNFQSLIEMYLHSQKQIGIQALKKLLIKKKQNLNKNFKIDIKHKFGIIQYDSKLISDLKEININLQIESQPIPSSELKWYKNYGLNTDVKHLSAKLQKSTQNDDLQVIVPYLVSQKQGQIEKQSQILRMININLYGFILKCILKNYTICFTPELKIQLQSDSNQAFFIKSKRSMIHFTMNFDKITNENMQKIFKCQWPSLSSVLIQRKQYNFKEILSFLVLTNLNEQIESLKLSNIDLIQNTQYLAQIKFPKLQQLSIFVEKLIKQSQIIHWIQKILIQNTSHECKLWLNKILVEHLGYFQEFENRIFIKRYYLTNELYTLKPLETYPNITSRQSNIQTNITIQKDSQQIKTFLSKLYFDKQEFSRIKFIVIYSKVSIEFISLIFQILRNRSFLINTFEINVPKTQFQIENQINHIIKIIELFIDSPVFSYGNLSLKFNSLDVQILKKICQLQTSATRKIKFEGNVDYYQILPFLKLYQTSQGSRSKIQINNYKIPQILLRYQDRSFEI